MLVLRLLLLIFPLHFLAGVSSGELDGAEAIAEVGADTGEGRGDWPVHGRTHDEQRFSPLTGITPANVGSLGLAWSYEIGSRRGIETTPIVVDGALYGTGSWSIVYALAAASGRELWRFDPKVPKWKGRDACCGPIRFTTTCSTAPCTSRACSSALRRSSVVTPAFPSSGWRIEGAPQATPQPTPEATPDGRVARPA